MTKDAIVHPIAACELSTRNFQVADYRRLRLRFWLVFSSCILIPHVRLKRSLNQGDGETTDGDTTGDLQVCDEPVELLIFCSGWDWNRGNRGRWGDHRREWDNRRGDWGRGYPRDRFDRDRFDRRRGFDFD